MPNGNTILILLAINIVTYSGTELLRKLSTGRGGHIRHDDKSHYARSEKRQKRKRTAVYRSVFGSSWLQPRSSSPIAIIKELYE